MGGCPFAKGSEITQNVHLFYEWWKVLPNNTLKIWPARFGYLTTRSTSWGTVALTNKLMLPQLLMWLLQWKGSLVVSRTGWKQAILVKSALANVEIKSYFILSNCPQCCLCSRKTAPDWRTLRKEPGHGLLTRDTEMSSSLPLPPLPLPPPHLLLPVQPQ